MVTIVKARGWVKICMNSERDQKRLAVKEKKRNLHGHIEESEMKSTLAY